MKFQKGDKVRRDRPHPNLKIGEEYTVSYCTNMFLKLEEEGRVYFDVDYFTLSKSIQKQEKELLKKFKVGQKVKCINSRSRYFTKEKVYEVGGKYHGDNMLGERLGVLYDDQGVENGWGVENFELLEETKPSKSDLKRGYWTTSNIPNFTPEQHAAASELMDMMETMPGTYKEASMPVKESGGTKHDNGKADLSILPFEQLEEVARALEFGSVKYGRNNYKDGLEITRLLGAALRHIGSFSDGTTNDPESGLNHISHAICNLLFILYMMKNKPEMDNR